MFDKFKVIFLLFLAMFFSSFVYANEDLDKQLVDAIINNKSIQEIDELVNSGADINAKDREGKTVYRHALDNKEHPDIAEYIWGKMGL